MARLLLAPRPVVRRALALALMGLLTLGLGVSSARAVVVPPGTQPSAYVPAPAFGSNPAVQRLHYRYGPLRVRPGSNMIMLGGNVPKPAVDGYIVGIRPSLTLSDGTVPSVNVIHLHHGVWLNLSAHNATWPNEPELFFASGEEKTWMQLPSGFGYPYRVTDQWMLNYMLHNLTPVAFTVYITYEIDFVPATSAMAATLRPVHPVWMDVENGKAYPVFDAHRGTGVHGLFTFPNDARNPYGTGPVRNEWTAPAAATLVGFSGHVHPGGLYNTLEVVRPGVTVAPTGKRSAPIPGDVPHSVRVFRAQAHYWDPKGAVSWDMAMTVTRPTWRVALRPGDVLRVDSTYDVRRQSWYEVMGIMVGFVSYDAPGVDPFTTPVQTTGYITHGLLPENADPFGGAPVAGLPDPVSAIGTTAPRDTVQITNFSYTPGAIDQQLGNGLSNPPVIKRGQSLTFVNNDNTRDIYHTITACSTPCTASTGTHFPLADNRPSTAFDSAELGTGPPGFTAASGKVTWRSPTNLGVGTYTYFCRVHPFMRGAFRVVP